MRVRPSQIAGSWYPDDPELLTRELHHYLQQAQAEPPPGKIWGVVVPHAGYRYSGPVAAQAFSCLRGLQPGLVVVISPLHQFHPAPVLTTGCDAYQTPLDLVEVDHVAVRDLDQALRNRLGYGLTALPTDSEHALEIELPFLQQVLGKFRLLPVMLRRQGSEIVKALGETLAEISEGQRVLFVASSDLSHFYPQQVACRFDKELLRRLEQFDPQAILDSEAEGVGFACGRGAIAAVLWATRALGANRVTVLEHATSGDVSGDFSSVVGYGAAVIWEDRSGSDWRTL